VLDGAVTTIEHHESGVVASLGGQLGNQLSRQVELEVRQCHGRFGRDGWESNTLHAAAIKKEAPDWGAFMVQLSGAIGLNHKVPGESRQHRA
jgi:hypothetical protein